MCSFGIIGELLTPSLEDIFVCLTSLHHPEIIIFLAEPKSPQPSISFLGLDRQGYSSLFFSPASPTSFHGHLPIWCFAKISPQSISTVNSSPHHMTLSVLNHTTGLFYFITAVHAPTDAYKRRVFWDKLSDYESIFSWGIIGDFNAILDPSERWSRSPPNISALNDFQAIVSSNGTLDLGFKGKQLYLGQQ